MRNPLPSLVRRLMNRLFPKALVAHGGMGGGWLDAYRRRRTPTAGELLDELKNTAFTCATINAAVCASFPPRLYVATRRGQPAPKCPTKALDRDQERRLRAAPCAARRVAKAQRIEEVIDHPLLDLLGQVNPLHNGFDLWEHTTLYQEIFGAAYWLLEFGPLGVPDRVWILPTQCVTPVCRPGSGNFIDAYEYRAGTATAVFTPEEIVHFRYPDPRNPYVGGLSPLRACFENAAMASEYLAFKRATWDNAGLPSAVLTPADAIGEEERKRLEIAWQQRFARGGNGKLLVTDYNMKVELLSHSMGDLAALAEYGATVRDVCNAFHVPLSFLTSETNLANLQAAEAQHVRKAIRPRNQRRDEKLNERLVPLFDPGGRLFLASDDPVPENQEFLLQQREQDLKYGIQTINEVRAGRGLPPVAWGDRPWLPGHWIPTDQPRINYEFLETDNRDKPNVE